MPVHELSKQVKCMEGSYGFVLKEADIHGVKVMFRHHQGKVSWSWWCVPGGIERAEDVASGRGEMKDTKKHTYKKS